MKTISQVIFLLRLLTTNILNNYIIPIIKQKTENVLCLAWFCLSKMENKKYRKFSVVTFIKDRSDVDEEIFVVF